jgi:hypothetical protein
MPIVTPNDYINVGGKVDILVAFAPPTYSVPNWPFSPARGALATTATAAYQQLFKLGELEEEIEPQTQNITGRVQGDRYGGSAGDGIETQFFGQTAEIDLVLSRWDEEVWRMMKSNGGLTATINGAIPLNNIGAFMQRDRSFRLLLLPNRDARFIRNFPCCLIERGFSSNISTKYSRLQARIAAHRTPEGHWSDPTGVAGTSTVAGSTTIGVLENSDITGTAA